VSVERGDEQGIETESDEARVPPAEDAVAVPERAQRINSVIFIINNSLNYLVAPVLYVGVLHAAILSGGGASDTVANLPSSLYTWMTPLPVLISWMFPSRRHFSRLWISSYLVMGSAGLLEAALCWGAPPKWQAAGLALHACCIGAANGVMNMCQWEMLSRGMTTKRRARTLSVTFGAGPILAVVGSGITNLILSGNFLDLVQGGKLMNLIPITPLEKPWSYIVLFGATGPAMLAAAITASFATLPPSPGVEPRPSVESVQAGLKQYFSNRLILVALFGFLMTYGAGNLIMANLGLYVRDAIGEEPEKYTGVQMALRFGCKSLFGFFLGWLLARFHPKTPALTTTLVCIAGLAWAIWVPGKWYLFSFGLLGAGELFYVYYLNYIVGCSPPSRVREFTAYTNVLLAVVGFMPLMYGAISKAYDLRTSFGVAEGILIATALIVAALLPRQPRRAGDT